MQLRNCGWCGEESDDGDHKLCAVALVEWAEEHEAAATSAYLRAGQIIARRLDPAEAA